MLLPDDLLLRPNLLIGRFLHRVGRVGGASLGSPSRFDFAVAGEGTGDLFDLAFQPTHKPISWFRGDTRWCSHTPRPARLRRRSVYLVTGGRTTPGRD